MSFGNACGLRPTASERRAGRFMRADDHTAADAAAAAPDAAAAAAGAVDAGAVAAEAAAATVTDQGTTSGAAAEGEAKPAAGADGDDTSLAGGAGAPKAEGEGAKETAAEVLGAPEGKYELTPPEGQTFDQAAFDAVEPTLRKLNLSPAAAQQLVDAYGKEVVPMIAERATKQAEEAQTTRAAEVRAEWASAARKDPEIGGAKFDQTIDRCAAVWDKFGIQPKEGIRLLLDESGLGNHPDMLRFLSRVATVTGEGQYVSSDGRGADTRPVWDRVYQPEPASAGTGA